MEYVFLENIVVYGSHGVYQEEKYLGNKFCIDIKVYGDFEEAKKTDELADTVDYVTIFEIIVEVSKERINLIEYLANKIVSRISELKRVNGVELTIRKESPALNGEVACSGYFIRKNFN